MSCDSKQRVRHAFDRGASRYSQLAKVQQQIAEQFFVYAAPSGKEGGQVLDIGCGTGFLTRQLASRFPCCSLVALDVAPKMLACMDDLPDVEKIAADFDSIPFPDVTFDRVFSSMALQWSQDIEKTWTECLRVLKSGGEFCFSIPVSGTLSEWDTCWESIGDDRRVNSQLTAEALQSLALPAGCEWQAGREAHFTDYHFTIKEALASVREIGAGKRLQPAKKSCLIGQKKWQSFLSAYEKMRTDQGLPLSYEVFYGIIKKK